MSRQAHEDARWLGFAPDDDDEQQTGDASDGCGEPVGGDDEQEQ